MTDVDLAMGAAIDIDDPADPRVAPFVQVRERDVAGRAGGFIAEGEVVLRVLARSPRLRAASLLVARDRAEKLSSLLACFPQHTPVYVASQAVMDQVVGFPIHRGVLAFGLRPPPVSADDVLADIGLGPALVLVLMGISNHDNIGGLFRNAAAFGVAGVLLDCACCDPLYRKAIRVSAGAALLVPFARLRPGEDALDILERHAFTPLALCPGAGETLDRLLPPPRAAVLLGAEGAGLAAATLARARGIAIPMAGGFDSLNVATTGGIVLHHLAVSRPS